MGEVGSSSQRAGRAWEAFQWDGSGWGPSRWAGRDQEALPDSRERLGGEGENGRLSQRTRRSLGVFSESREGLEMLDEVGSPTRRARQGWEVIKEGWEGL